jgi:phosphoribosylanthranilate isomerase
MTKTFVKICGITNIEDALLCAQLGADALGFNFYAGSPRVIDPSKAALITSRLPSKVKKVGVFVNAGRSVIERLIHAVGLDIVQLSGDEAPEACLDYPVEVWKAFRIEQPAHVEATRRYTIAAALLDGAPADQYGGSGRAPDLTVAAELKKHHRLILAGGLGPGNIEEIVRAASPFGVDVNSGVELTPGKKDMQKVAQLLERINILASTC